MSKTSTSFNSAQVLRIMVSILFICMGIGGFVDSSASQFAGPIYDALGEEVITYILTTVIMLAGFGLLIPMFVKGMPASVEKVSMIAAMAFWAIVIVFKDFVPGFSGFDGEDLLNWLQSFAIDLIILFAITQVCSKALK